MNIIRKSALKKMGVIGGVGALTGMDSPDAIATKGTKKRESNYNVKDYGEKGDGRTLNTKAIDACARSGGGKVIIPAGTFLSGTIYLKSNVNLFFEAGAVLKGSDQIKNYHNPKNHLSALILAINLHHVSITGSGTIDGSGKIFHKMNHAGDRPMLMFFYHCKNVSVNNIHLNNAGFWVQKYTACDGVLITGVSVYSLVNGSNDGVDINGSRNVVIFDSQFDTDDDAICLKSEGEEFCKNVAITNCIVASNCNGSKMGTVSTGGFQNISISNCVIRQASEDYIRHWQKNLTNIMEKRTVISGIAIESVAGGKINQVNINNITMKDVQPPIFIRLGARHKPAGSIQHVNISNIIATSESDMCSTISGIPDHKIDDVSIHNVQLINHAAGKVNNHLNSIPENIRGYPENRMFGTELSAAGFYVRHVKDIKLSYFFCKLCLRSRPYLVADDVHKLIAKNVEFNSQTNSNFFPVVYYLRDIWAAVIKISVFLPKFSSLMHIKGKNMADIPLFLRKEIKESKRISFGDKIKEKNQVKVFAP